MAQTFDCPKCHTSNPFLATNCGNCGVNFAYEKPKETTIQKEEVTENKSILSVSV